MRGIEIRLLNAGMILETLMNVDADSQEFEMEHGGGTCDGQGMPVSRGWTVCSCERIMGCCFRWRMDTLSSVV